MIGDKFQIPSLGYAAGGRDRRGYARDRTSKFQKKRLEFGVWNLEFSRSRPTRGFTLVEILVVVAIFTISSVAISAISINYTHLHRRTANAARLGEDLRFATELIVRLARNRRIDYPALPGALAAKSPVLPLIDTNGNRLVVQLLPSTDAACAGLNANCLAVALPATGVTTTVTGKNVNVTRFDVYVTPTVTPFQISGGAYNNNTQPRVTFVIDAAYVATSTKEVATLGIQTTVASRVYVR